MKNNKVNQIFLMDLDTYLEIVELAQKRGKKAGDNMTSEFKEVIKKRANKINFLGNTNLDIDVSDANSSFFGFGNRIREDKLYVHPDANIQSGIPQKNLEIFEDKDGGANYSAFGGF